MKKCLTGYLFLLGTDYAFAQTATLPYNSQTGALEYIGVVDSVGLMKNELYEAAINWTSANIKNSKDILHMSLENGEVAVDGALKYTANFLVGGYANGEVRFNFKIFVKDGKYKYQFTDFVHTATNPANNWPPEHLGLITKSDVCSSEKGAKGGMAGKGITKMCNDVKNQTNTYIVGLIANLKKSMSTKVEKAGGDW